MGCEGRDDSNEAPPDRVAQAYALADMLFGPAELVSRLSHDMTLEPGDVILCGTSLGVLVNTYA